MNDELIKLLNTLAVKLGVTAEHLWSVLLVQAKYQVLISVLQFALIFTLVFLLRKWVKKLKDANDDFFEPAFVGQMVVYLLVSVCLIDEIHTIFVCLFNPEYWAITQVLKQ